MTKCIGEPRLSVNALGDGSVHVLCIGNRCLLLVAVTWTQKQMQVRQTMEDCGEGAKGNGLSHDCKIGSSTQGVLGLYVNFWLYSP